MNRVGKNIPAISKFLLCARDIDNIDIEYVAILNLWPFRKMKELVAQIFGRMHSRYGE